MVAFSVGVLAACLSSAVRWRKTTAAFSTCVASM